MPATLLSPSQVDRLVDDHAHIAAPSDAVQRLLEVTSDPDLETPPGEVAEILSHEPALAAQVLQWVNSAVFALPKPVADVARAIPLLGLNRIRALALAHAFFSRAAKRRMVVYGMDGRTFCLHALETALGAAHLMAGQEPPRQGEAFTAGLLHDLGMLLVEGIGRDRHQGEPLLPEDDRLLEEERRLLGTDHTALGAALARRWRLPEPLAAAMGRHHDLVAHNPSLAAWNLVDDTAPVVEAPDLLTRVVQVADRLSADRLQMGQPDAERSWLRRHRDLVADDTELALLERQMDRAAGQLAALLGEGAAEAG